MKFLIDTNIFIPLEPASLVDVEAGTPEATKFARLTSEAGHQLYVHPAALEDIRRDENSARRKLREILFGKYPRLPDPPEISSQLENILGCTTPKTNDWVDNLLLAALQANAVDFLVTEVLNLRRKAMRLNMQDRLATLAEAIAIVQDLFDKMPPPPPAVSDVKAHVLNETDPIFDSFRSDYPNFDAWLAKCKREHRQAWVIYGEDGYLAGFCIVKQEKSGEFGFTGKVLKICSFKVSEEYNGSRFGELLLKTIFTYANENKYGYLYVTVFEKYDALIILFRDFGFQDSGARTKLGEVVLAKPMTFTEADCDSCDSLAFNIRYGPFAMKIKGVPAFIVPIKPRYYRLLFPEAEKQLELEPGGHPFGNSIRKAYLSNAVIRKVSQGANLLFYRSKDLCGVIALGVVEGTLVSSSPNEIARYVGKRTVYRFSEIETLCHKGVLAILFRQSRILKREIPLEELIKSGVLRAAPQSISKVPEGTTEWIQTRVGV